MLTVLRGFLDVLRVCMQGVVMYALKYCFLYVMNCEEAWDTRVWNHVSHPDTQLSVRVWYRVAFKTHELVAQLLYFLGLLLKSKWAFRASILATKVYQNDAGDATCVECFALGDKQRFLSKVTNFVWSMDAARLLHYKMFAKEGADDFIQSLRNSANYLRRLKSMYETTFGWTLEHLHQKMRSSWTGRITAGPMTEALQMFVAMYVTPCLDCEPSASMKQVHLDRLLSFMQGDPDTGVRDLDIVKAVVTGQVSRHPAVHGTLCAIMNKLRQWQNGTHTMRNRHRCLSGIVRVLLLFAYLCYLMFAYLIEEEIQAIHMVSSLCMVRVSCPWAPPQLFMIWVSCPWAPPKIILFSLNDVILDTSM